MKKSHWEYVVSLAPSMDYSFIRYRHWWDRWRLWLGFHLMPSTDAPHTSAYTVHIFSGNR